MSMPNPSNSLIANAKVAEQKPLVRKLTWWVILFPVVMFMALAKNNLYWLNFSHFILGVLWIGAGIFMGVMVGSSHMAANDGDKCA